MPHILSVKPGTRIRLSEFDPGLPAGSADKSVEKSAARKETAEHTVALISLAHRLYAENARALLVVLQGMDTAGKDGVIRNCLAGFNPLSCQVTAFKIPSAEELDHDFLWRIHAKVPARGNIGIFNRSHYEDVIAVRVHKLAPKAVWSSRYEKINAFEKLLDSGGTRILKLFLHISKEEQRTRLQARLDDPEKRWKFRLGDLEDRKKWDDYQEAYADALSKCNTAWAPWYVIPADVKWYRDLVVSRLLRKTLEELDPRFPSPDPDLDGLKVV
jgi:PPK2 family polyphosphate:nucleotide phosphotransferase